MRRVLVTGGTRGIGYAIATSFKEAGYKVCVAYIGGPTEAQKIEKDDISAIEWDISNFEVCKANISKVEERLGGNIEILINNAGITRDGMLHKQSRENWDALIDVNLSSVFNMSRVVIEKMRENKFGRIISMSSVNAHGMLGQTNYSAAKAGIEGFTQALALEGARYGITANAIAPGYVNTEMVAAMPKEALDKIIERVPMGRLAEVHEIARAALFLAAEEAGFMTGVVLPINGGLRLY
ncbi:MAG: 3-oxoacyl-ACP reductase [Candidatus Midichloria sp.]|nr:3-oxoacyl-ACP reductase [Candidatus Midichloria sp.]MDJ1304735.1 3-oxoacyl-ACP reductase [Candidatus Midichloria sp.]